MTFSKYNSNKYKKHGAYHWMWYASKPKYISYVNHVKEWVQEKNTLDVGAGDGLIASVLGIKGVDYEPDAISLAKEKGVEITLGDVHNLPYKDEEFDSVFTGNTLEHFEFPEMALKECRRILKKYLYIVVSIVEGSYSISKEELKKQVESAGFVLEGEIWAEGDAWWGKFKKI